MKNKSLNKKLIKEVENKHPINKADNDWLDKIYRKSKADRSRIVAQTSLKAFDIFCESRHGKTSRFRREIRLYSKNVRTIQDLV